MLQKATRTIEISASYSENTNKLRKVGDAVGTCTSFIDVDNQSTNNYDYDAIGNLVKDNQEYITGITWTLAGKVKSVVKDKSYKLSTCDLNGDGFLNDELVLQDIEFQYDAMGNRIAKIVKPHLSNAQGLGLSKQESWVYTYYVRDAQGNVMATYDRNVDITGSTVTDKVTLKELDIYGSSRVGVKNTNILAGGITFTAAALPGRYNADGTFAFTSSTAIAADPLPVAKRTLTTKMYELSNHLGNVIVVVGDKKLGINSVSAAPAVATYYTARVLSASDYYSKGIVILIGRKEG